MANSYDPAQAAQNWVNKMGQSQQKYKDGVLNCPVNPCAEAARQESKWAANVAQAAAEGRFSKGLNKVSKEQWSSRTASVGAARLLSGAQGSQQKFANFHNQLKGYIESAKSAISSMPHNNSSDGIARVSKYLEVIAASKGKYNNG